MDLITIDFEPIGKRVTVEPGITILDAARQAGIELVAVCGGAGTCKKCQVQVIEGYVENPSLAALACFSKEQVEKGWRLACQTMVWHSTKIYLPPDSLTTHQRLQSEGIEIEDQWLKSITENAIQSSNPIEREYGLAVDLGTTKIAAYLVDLGSGRTISKGSVANPQIHYGEDVISRIQFCVEKPEGRKLLQRKVIASLNSKVRQLCREGQIMPEQVTRAVVVGNTVMHHLFTGLPVEQLGLAPFQPALVDAMQISAQELGLAIARAAQIYLPENIAGYVGGDHVAMMIATQAHHPMETTLALDIGTNTEISLAHRGKTYTCSCASGPAFEGAHIKHGMRAANGAIERVEIDGDAIFTQTILDQPAIGICGSGILDAIAELRRNSIVNERGNFIPGHRWLQGTGKDTEYILVPKGQSGCDHDITITRRDINEILLAKAAIQTGIKVLLESAGIVAQEISRFIIAGAFGTYLSIESAIQIGMFPDLPMDRFSQVGNAAGSGARLMLVSADSLVQAAQFARETNYIELTLYPDFQKTYIESLKLRKM